MEGHEVHTREIDLLPNRKVVLVNGSNIGQLSFNCFSSLFLVQLPPKVSASYDVLYPWTDEVAVTQKPTERPSSAQTSIILGALGGAISIFFVIVVALCYRQRTIKKTLVS